MKTLMKLLLIIIACIIAIIIASCINDPKLIYHSNSWAVKQINDTVLVCIPMHENTNKPFIMNIKTFDNSEYNSEYNE